MPARKNHLSLELPTVMNSLLSSIEEDESWVLQEENFLSKVRMLRKDLVDKSCRMNFYRFQNDFVSVGAFSCFRDSISLMQSLSCRNSDVLQSLLVSGMSGDNIHDPNWWVHAMRIAWLARVSALVRIFSEERITLVEQALARRQKRKEE